MDKGVLYRIAGPVVVAKGIKPRMYDVCRVGNENLMGEVIQIDGEKIMEGLEQHQRLDIDASVEPVFIPVSTRVEQDSLRRLIKKSVGVDLWK